MVSEPAPMSDEDVERMAAGGTPSLKRRIAAHNPSDRTGKLSDAKLSPARITRAEMDRIQPRGRLTKELRERLDEAAKGDEPTEPAGPRKQSPKREPDPR